MTAEKNQLGKLVGEIRKEKGIRQLELCQGICSVSMLSRIEQGKKEPDKMLLEALFERLGKTLLYWEKVLNNDDIRLFQLQVEINSFLEEKNLEVVQMLLKKYKNFKGVSVPLHKQYKMFANARLLQLQNKNKEAMEELQRALEITLVNLKEDNFQLKKYYLCYQEIEVYLAWAELAVRYEKEKGYEALQQLIDYIDTKVENNPEMNRIYTIAVHKLACEKASRGKLEEAWFLCRKGIKIKRESKNLDKLKPLLRLQMEIENKLGFQKEKNEVLRYNYKANGFDPGDEAKKQLAIAIAQKYNGRWVEHQRDISQDRHASWVIDNYQVIAHEGLREMEEEKRKKDSIRKC